MRHGFDLWVGKIPWRRASQCTPVLLPGEFHGQRSLAGYSPQGFKESDMTEVTYHACMRCVDVSHGPLHIWFSCDGHAGTGKSPPLFLLLPGLQQGQRWDPGVNTCASLWQQKCTDNGEETVFEMYGCSCLVAKSCPTRQPHGLQHASSSILCYLLEFAQIHVCCVGDAI